MPNVARSPDRPTASGGASGRAAQVPLAVGRRRRAISSSWHRWRIDDNTSCTSRRPAARNGRRWSPPGNAERTRQGMSCLTSAAPREAVIPALDGQAPSNRSSRVRRRRWRRLLSGRQAPRHPSEGQPVSANKPRVWRASVSSVMPGAARWCPCARGDEGAQVSVSLARLGQQDEVGAVAAGDTVSSAPRSRRDPVRAPGRTERRREVVVIGRARAGMPNATARHERLRFRAPSSSEKTEWQWSST